MVMDYLFTNSTLKSLSSNQTCMIFFRNCDHNPIGTYFWLTFDVITILLGPPANITVLWLLRTSRFSPSEILVFLLVVNDTLFCLSLFVDLLTYWFNDLYIIYTTYFFSGLNLFVRPLLFSCICIDRCLAVLHPLTYMLLKDSRARLVGCAVVTVGCLGLCLFMCLTVYRYALEYVAFSIPPMFMLMVFCNLFMVRALKTSGPGLEKTHPVKKKALKTIGTLLAGIVVFYCPLLLFSVAYLITGSNYCTLSDNMACIFLPLGYGWVTLTSCLGSLQYLHSAGKLPSWKWTGVTAKGS